MSLASLLVLGVALSALAFVAFVIAALARWKGPWRAAAAVPALALAVVVGRIALGVRDDPTSHNLWPLELAVWTALGLAALGAIALARAIVAGARARRGAS
jgi:hypothetical protein